MKAAAEHDVLYYEGPGPGGATGVIDALVQGSPHFRLEIICRDTPPLRQWAEILRSSGITVRSVALRNWWDLLGWFDLLGLIRLFHIFRAARLVHFHLHTPFSCIPAIMLAGLNKRCKIITTEHYISQLRYLRRRKLFIGLSLVRELKIAVLIVLKRWSLGIVDQVVTVSDANRLFMLSVFGSSLQRKLTTIPNGVDVRRFVAGSGNTPVEFNGFILNRETYRYVAVVAALNNQKGHEFLFRAIPLIRGKLENVVFLLVGDGHIRASLETLARSLGIAQNVLFTGKRTDVPAILAASELFVLPSLFEGMPLSVLEAMAAGKAVVATNVDGTAELVEDGVTGFLVPPKNSELLAQRIVQLLTDSTLCKEFGDHGRERVRRLYTIEAMCKRYSDLYELWVQRAGVPGEGQST
jgi:glycosyltransferase involved in cell wall biosynthesis